jgi:N-acetylmuramoyl-L-alanine amidase
MSRARLLVACLLLLGGLPWVARSQPAPAGAGAKRPDPEALAEADYQKARKAYYALREDAKRQKLRHHWLGVIQRFEAVARDHARSRRAADALFTAGRLYQDLYLISRLPEDLEQAVRLFTSLVESHPRSNLADDGQFALALYWLERKKDTRRAIASLTYLVEQFPDGDVTPKARRMLEDLGGPPADEPAMAARPGPRPAPMVDSRPEPQPAPPPEGERASLSEVQVDSGKQYTRVTLLTGAACTYKWGLLPAGEGQDLHRLYVDLKDTLIDPNLKGPIEVRDSAVLRVRFAPFQKDVTRVVVDLKTGGEQKVFPMDSPSRVVIDVSAAADAKASVIGQKARAAQDKAQADKARNGKVGDDRPAAEPDGEKRIEQLIAAADRAEKAGEDVEAPPVRPAKPGRAPVPKSLSKPGRSLSMLAGLKVRRVVIDPGHGGRDPGAIGKAGTLEKDITLDISKRLRKLLLADASLGLKEVHLTRTEDTTLALEKRTAFANKKDADLFISIHCNAHRNSKFRGVETFYLDLTDDRYSIKLAARENATSEKTISDLKFILADLALKSHVDDSIALGESIQKATVGSLKRSYKNIVDLKLKPALFYVLIGARMPSVLVEASFLSNPEEEKRLNTPAYREDLARGIYTGLKNFIQARELALEPG